MLELLYHIIEGSPSEDSKACCDPDRDQKWGHIFYHTFDRFLASKSTFELDWTQYEGKCARWPTFHSRLTHFACPQP